MDASDAASIDEYRSFLDGSRGYLLHEALNVVWRMIARSNEFVQLSAPWALAKEDKSPQLDAVLASLSRQIAIRTALLFPFMPAKAKAVWQTMGAAEDIAQLRLDTLGSLSTADWVVTKGQPLFPRHERTSKED